MFLAKASGQNIQTPTPITREEYFLSKITGGGGSVEGTAIPVGVPVEKIYINANNTLEQTKAYLSQLTYVQTPFFAFPIYPIFACVGDGGEGLYLFVIKYDTHYELIGCSSLEKEIGCMIYTNDDRKQSNRTEGVYDYRINDSGVVLVNKPYYIESKRASLTDLNGLPIGAENEKIKNVLSITPFTGGTSSNKPTAYTVSSVDELPSNAVDGSTAIVENDDLDGWWELNSELTQPDGEILVGFEVLDFDGNLYSMKKITQEERGDGFDLLYVRNSDEYETLFVYEYYIDEGSHWGFFGYRRIKVDTSINTPTTSQEQWFRENAKKLKSLYTRENGSWVYKCEVV